MTAVKAKDLGKYIGKQFEFSDVLMGIQVSTSGTVVSLEPIEDIFGLGDLVVEYEDEDGDLSDFLVYGNKTFQIAE